MRYLIFSDVHGNAHALQHAIYMATEHDEPGTAYTFISCGDLIDRGRHTRNCFDFLLSQPGEKIWLAGNHEALLLESLTGNVAALESWVNGGFGAQATMWSYGFSPGRIGTANNAVWFDDKRIVTAADVGAVLLAVFGERHLAAIESSGYKTEPFAKVLTSPPT